MSTTPVIPPEENSPWQVKTTVLFYGILLLAAVVAAIADFWPGEMHAVYAYLVSLARAVA